MAFTTPGTAVAGEVLTAAFWNTNVRDNIAQLATGYTLSETVYFTASGTFTKATYPWLRAIRVRCQGGGGGGAGAGVTFAEVAAGRGGGGGVYAESFITDIAGLASSVTVTVGAAGAGGATGTNAGTAGGTSSFGALVSAPGGNAGSTSDFGSVSIWNAGVNSPTTGGTGDLLIPGGGNEIAFNLSLNVLIGSRGGDSFWGRGGTRGLTFASGSGANGNAGAGLGGGGAGGLNAQGNNSTTRAGGAGTIGRILLELYA
jgi:hypothetical protein